MLISVMWLSVYNALLFNHITASLPPKEEYRYVLKPCVCAYVCVCVCVCVHVHCCCVHKQKEIICTHFPFSEKT